MKVSISQAKTHLSELISRSLNGETIVISKRNIPLVKIIPIDKEFRPWSCLGILKGKMKIKDDFNQIVDDFKDYV